MGWETGTCNATSHVWFAAARVNAASPNEWQSF